MLVFRASQNTTWQTLVQTEGTLF